MTQDKLPAYFREFLEEKFNGVMDEIAGVKEDVQAVKEDVSDLKKTVQGLESVPPVVKKNEVRMSKLIIAIALIALVLLIHTIEDDKSWIHSLIYLLF